MAILRPPIIVADGIVIPRLPPRGGRIRLVDKDEVPPLGHHPYPLFCENCLRGAATAAAVTEYSDKTAEATPTRKDPIEAFVNAFSDL